MDCYMRKASNNTLVPSDIDAQQYIKKLSVNEEMRVTVKRPRNIKFFRKWWALVNYAYEFWEPEEAPEEVEKKWMKEITPRKDKDQFRKDLTILAGHYNAFYRINGSVRIEAKSISFHNMSEDDFALFYSSTIDAVLKHICTNFDVPGLENAILDFA